MGGGFRRERRDHEWTGSGEGAGVSRRSRNDPDKRAFYLVFCPTDTTLAELRWTIEECFQRAKDDLGLDHCEARSWHGWRRHMGLVVAAAAFLAKLAADLRRMQQSERNEPHSANRRLTLLAHLIFKPSHRPGASTPTRMPTRSARSGCG